jgi:hypothetical protein
MKDDDARYLIDQFNKQASWESGDWGRLIPYIALITALEALAIPALGIHPDIGIVITVFFVILVTALALTVADSLNRRSYRFRLDLLEDYRYRHKCLPDGITFRTVDYWKPKQLARFLAEHERSPTGSPQT